MENVMENVMCLDLHRWVQIQCIDPLIIFRHALPVRVVQRQLKVVVYVWAIQMVGGLFVFALAWPCEFLS